MSSIGVTGSSGDPGDLLGWKRRGERLLRVRGLPDTVIRPGWFDAGDANELRAELRQGDATSYGPVRREDVAEALGDWGTAFDAVTADTPGSLDGAADSTELSLDREPEQVRADLQRLTR